MLPVLLVLLLVWCDLGHHHQGPHQHSLAEAAFSTLPPDSSRVPGLRFLLLKISIA